jgi:hypothetical protein
MKSFDLEKLQSLTLSGEKITKEMFEALFINPSPYHHYHTPSSVSGFYSFNFNPQPVESAIEGSAFHYQQQHQQQQSSEEDSIVNTSFNVRNYEIFKGAFETAVNCGKSMEIGSEYPFYENRFYQQTAQQNYNY